MPAEDARRSRARPGAAGRREIRRRQVRRRRAAALGVIAAAIVLLVLALGTSGGRRVLAAGTAAETPPPVSPAVADRAVRRMIKAAKPIYCGGRNRPYVALTFDDGPGPSTGQALDVLESLRVPATFFLIGEHIGPFRSVLPREAQLGAIGDHTLHHVQLTSLSLTDAGHEVENTAKAITAVTHAPVRLLRPPLGSRNFGVDSVARAEGTLEILWDIDVKDIEGATGAQVLAAVAHHVKPGSIILMHENAPQTLGSLKAIVAAVLAKGLRPVTVPELLAIDPPSAQQVDAGPQGCGLAPTDTTG